MFFKWPNVPPEALPPDRAALVALIGEGLPKAEIVEMMRRFVTLKLPGGEIVEGDVAQSGFTVYLGGFDWVTFPTPPRLLQKFPEFMPLPQQIFKSEEGELLEEF